MTIPALFVVALAIPVLLLGEVLVRRIRLLSRFNIPAPVVGGLLVSLLVLLGHLSGLFAVHFQNNVTARWWTWLVTAEVDWFGAPSKNVNTPFLVGFFRLAASVPERVGLRPRVGDPCSGSSGAGRGAGRRSR